MEYYNLISCSPSVYPDILCRVWDGRHPLEGLVVYITGLVNGQPANPQFTYELVYLGTNACVGSEYVPKIQPSTFNTCSPANLAGWEYRNCETGESRIFAFNTVDPVNSVLRIDGDCDCWELVQESNGAEQLISDYSEYDTCFDCIKARDVSACPTGERTLSFATRLALPQPIVPDRGFKECCYRQEVFADLTDSDPYKNDFNGFYFKRPTSNSTVVFTLLNVDTQLDYLLNDDTYGSFQDFGGAAQPDLSFYVVDWRKVLQLLGKGSYQIVQEITIAGQQEPYPSAPFHLRPFSIDAADHTVRIEADQDGIFTRLGVDFANTGFRSSLRLRGFFGRVEREYTIEPLTRSNGDTSAPRIRIEKVYTFQANQLPECVGDYLMDFLAVGSLVRISDYNKNNHSYHIIRKRVILADNSGTEYGEYTRNAGFNLSFSERDKNNNVLNCN